jgi:tyrosinase
MGDLFTSTNDPLFWMHHTNMDRIWALWQSQDPDRIMEVNGDMNLKETKPLTLDTILYMGFAGKDRPIKNVMDPINRDGNGILCYVYEDAEGKTYL